MASFMRKYGVENTIVFPVPKLDDTDFSATGDWTPAATDIRISKDAGTVVDCTNTAAAVAGTGSVLWKLVLTATEMQAATVTLQIVDAALENSAVTIETYGNASAMHAMDFDDAVRGGMTALPNAAADAAGGLPISDAGGLDIDTKLANTNEVTVARMGALTDLINGGRLDLIIDIIAADTTTDIPALIATAQADLDTLTGADGVTLATSQGNYAPLKPTTAGRTLDVTTTGAAGIDWANVENPTTAVDLSATDIQLCDTVTTNTDLVSAASVLSALLADGAFKAMRSFARGKTVVSGSTVVFYDDDDTTPLYTWTIAGTGSRTVA